LPKKKIPTSLHDTPNGRIPRFFSDNCGLLLLAEEVGSPTLMETYFVVPQHVKTSKILEGPAMILSHAGHHLVTKKYQTTSRATTLEIA
jgi:hypothetical protein